MRTILLSACGAFILLLVAFDVYGTVLRSRARGGPITEGLSRGLWSAARFIAFRLSRAHRHRFLSHIGPLLLPTIIASVIVLLISGFAFLYVPQMPDGFEINHHTQNSVWSDAYYFSGVTLTTVGYGDITPRTSPMRFLAVAEAAAGFALISLTVAYLISIFGALERRRAIALSFYHQAEEGADVAGFIAHHYVNGRFYGFDRALGNATSNIQNLLEAHIEHPLIYYFHPGEVHKSMSRILFITLETCTVIRACLNEEYRETREHPEVRTLDASGRHVLSQLVESLQIKRDIMKTSETAEEEMDRHRRRFRQTIQTLRRAGIETRQDIKQAWLDYHERREEWEHPLHCFSYYLGYDWREVTGDDDLRYAANEELETTDILEEIDAK